MNEEKETGSAQEQNQKRGRKSTTKVTFATVRIIKSFLDQKTTAEEAAKEAGMPISTFYRYAKMELKQLSAIARETLRAGMTPEQRESYDKAWEQSQKFKAVLDKARERQAETRAKFSRKAELEAVAAAKKKAGRPAKSTLEVTEHNNKPSDEGFTNTKAECYFCKNPFVIQDRANHAYKSIIGGKPKYCCSYSCHLALQKRKKGKK